MANLCESVIEQDILVNCDDPITGGLEPNAKIINRADIDFSGTEFDDTRKNVIKTVKLLPGKRAYDVYVPNSAGFTGTSTTFEVGTYQNTFTNSFQLIVFDNDPDVAEKIIDGFSKGSYVVVFENKYKNLNKATTPGDGTYQIMGWQNGLSATEIENDKYSDDTTGGWRVLMQEPKTAKSALFFFDTSLATTKAKFDSLTTIVPTP